MMTQNNTLHQEEDLEEETVMTTTLDLEEEEVSQQIEVEDSWDLINLEMEREIIMNLNVSLMIIDLCC